MKATVTANDRCLSDLHKDAYGFRPSPVQYEIWNSMSDDQLDEVEKKLHADVQEGYIICF